MTTRTPAPVNVPVTLTTTGPLDRAPAPVSAATDPELPRTPVPVLRPSAVAPAPAPAPYRSDATPAVVLPVQEAPVELTPAAEAEDRNIIPANTPRYVTVLQDGTVVVSQAAQLNFSGSGVSVVAQGSTANIVITSGSGSSYANANVAAFLAAYGSNTIATTGNITGGYLFGNGSQLTGINANYSNANVAAYLPTYTGNLAALAGNVTTTANVDGGNIRTTGVVSAVGNIAGSFFLGNGSQLTGLPTSYSNALVASYLPTYTGNLVALTGNVTTSANISGSYFIGNGSQLTGIAGGNTGNITFDNTTISAPDDESMTLQVRDDDQAVRSSLLLDSNDGLTRLSSLSSEREASYNTGNWSTATWTGNDLQFIDAPDIVAFVDTGDYNNSVNRTFSINGGPRLPYDGAGYGGNNISFYTSVAADPDPTTVTTIAFYYQYQSRIQMDHDDEEIVIQAQDMDIVIVGDDDISIEASDNIDIEAGGSIDIDSQEQIDLRSYSTTESVRIITDADNTTRIWDFDANGTLTLPPVTTSESTSERSSVKGTRQIVGQPGYWSAAIPDLNFTTVWTASSSQIESAKLTIVVQSNGASFNWEQFDVSLCKFDGANAFVTVSNRLRSNSAIPYTAVYGSENEGNQLEVILQLPVEQTDAVVNYHAVEFSIMND